MKGKIVLKLVFMFMCSTLFGQHDSFSISVNSEEIGMCNFEFYKYSTRPADQQVFTWDGTTLVPYTPGPIRTYRGTITNHSNYKAFAVWYSDNRLYIKVFKGKGERQGFRIVDIDLSNYTVTPLNLPTVDAPQMSTRSVSAGFSCVYSDLVKENKGNGDYDNMVAMFEHGVNLSDYFLTRDLALSIRTGLVVIPIDSIIAERADIIDPNDYLSQINEIPVFWKANGSGGGAGRNVYCVNPFKGGRTSYSRREFGSFPHEFGHTLNLGHWNNQEDAMHSNQYFLGRHSVRVATEHLELQDNLCLNNATPNYTDPLHPWVAEDYVNLEKNQFVDIDVLENDVDNNNEAITIKSFDAVSLNGGTITLQGNKLRYTPLPNFVGRDYFSYEAESGQGTGYFTNYAKVTLEVREDCNKALALHYSFEETTGTVVNDLGWNLTSQNGELKNADFSTNSVPGIVGNALNLNDPNELDLVALNDVLDPLDQEITVSVWFKLNEVPLDIDKNTRSKTIFDSGTRGNLGSSGVEIQATIDGIYFRAQPESYDNTGAELLDTTPLVANVWYHTVLIVDRTTNTLRAYVNGVEITTPSPDNNNSIDPDGIIKGYNGFTHATNPIKNRPATTLGARTTALPEESKFNLNGAIDELKIFTKALTAAEVSTLYNFPEQALVFNNDCNLLSTIENDFNNAKVILFPNPTNGIITVKNNFTEKIKKITVLSMLGKNVYKTSKLNDNDITIDLNHLPSGVYFVKIKWNNSTKSIEKIIIK